MNRILHGAYYRETGVDRKMIKEFDGVDRK